MKKMLFLTLILIFCGAGYLLFTGGFFNGDLSKGDFDKNKVPVATKTTQSQSSSPAIKNSTSENTTTELKQSSKDESAENKSPILACKPGWGDLWKSDEGDLLSEPEDVKNAFKTNTDFSAQFAYALSYVDKAVESEGAKEIETESRINLLLALMDEQPHSKMLNYFLISQCNGERDNSRCVDGLFERAKNNDTNNGAIWIQTAIFEAENENIAGAISALEQVSVANEFDSYWADSIELFDQALQSIGIENEQRRVVASIGYAAAVAIAPTHKLFELCRDQAPLRADLAQVCIDAGRRMAFDSKTLLNQSIGYGLQKVVYKALGDTENETKVSKLRDDNMEMPKHFVEASELMMHDLSLHRYWFEQLKLFGEKESFRLSTEEAIRLSSNPDYDPC
jgi:hypothetical protein